MNKNVISGMTVTLVVLVILTMAFHVQVVIATLPVHNINTGEDFVTIQEAIDDSDTQHGHTILVDTGTYYEHLNLNKSLTLIGQNSPTTIIDGEDVGNTITVTANDVEIRGFTITNSGNMHPDSGIFLDAVQNSNITNNNIFNSDGYGIFVMRGSNNSILGNIVTNNAQPGIRIDGPQVHAVVTKNTIEQNHPDGIFLYGASGVYIESNIISYNNHSGLTPQGGSEEITIKHNLIANNGWHGIFFYASNNSLIEANILSENGFGGPQDWVLTGIDLHYHSNNNMIRDNEIVGNKFGVALVNSNNTAIYHSDFRNNINQTWVDRAYGTSLDNGYPSGGNYWSNYAGVDLFNGPNQNKSGSDGIWDHPYTLDSNNTDNYPLVKPYVPGHLSVSIYADKDTYHAGDTIRLGLNVINPDSVKNVCFAIWVELPDSSIYIYMHEHSILLPIGTVYSNPTFDTIVLPSIPSGTYTWHAAFLERGTHTIIVEDTAEWQFV